MRLLSILTCSLLFSATTEFNVQGMMCGVGCASKIKTHIGSLEGVSKCDVNFNEGLLTVEYDESKMNDQVIVKALNDKTTYSCSVKKDKPKGFFKRILGWF